MENSRAGGYGFRCDAIAFASLTRLNVSMLHYLDFVPRQVRAPGFLDPGEYENFDAAVQAANDWLQKHRVKLINLETVVLPNIHSRFENGTQDPVLHTSGEMASAWHQFLRCWYMDLD